MRRPGSSKALRILRLLPAAAILLMVSCAGTQVPPGPIPGPPPVYPGARFAVFSDPHLYDAGLGTEGPAFQHLMDADGKLLPLSSEILAAALRKVREMRPDFLLVPGDLTKDGEEQDHLLMAEGLASLSREGTKVYVVPGNHDVDNPLAMRYSPEGPVRVPNVSPAEFARIYRDCGYDGALFRDPASLSYLAEPVPGLWLLAVDSARYSDNESRGSAESGGGITTERSAWIRSMLAEARSRGVPVIVMMHHGVVEHFSGQARYYPRYLVNDWQRFSDMLAAYGVRTVFTGHFHAQDVTRKSTKDGGMLFDIETGSLVTYPDPVRLVEIDPVTQRMSIRSSFITDLPSFAAEGRDFVRYSEEFLRARIAGLAGATMRKYGLSAEEAQRISRQVADAFMAHFKGDERFVGTEVIRTAGLSLLGRIMVDARRELVTGAWHDLEPADNDLAIDLSR